MKFARKISPLPLVADESIFTAHDLAKLIRLKYVDAVVLKLAKSGILGNLQIASVAEAFGLSLYGSDMTESGVGLAASIHLFLVLNIDTPVDTSGLKVLKDLIVKGLVLDKCKIKVPDGPGLGVKVNEEELEKYRVENKI